MDGQGNFALSTGERIGCLSHGWPSPRLQVDLWVLYGSI